MNVRNCRSCGKIFNYIAGLPICPACKETAEAKYQKVKEYVRENRGVSVREVARECEVDENQIRQWVREERLEFTTDSSIGIACESCGAPIATGRYCAQCKNALAGGLAAVGRQPVKPEVKKHERENARMRFLDK